ncbi:MAG: metal ABC transporter permease [Acutalibacteraceae bacterium]|nr:metal ABC transporter permease [Acutalibacteraceae bacterium]
MSDFISIFSYPFMSRALIVGILISLCSSLLGTSLVLKRYSMIGDGLSHVGFGALAIAAVLNLAPLTVAIPIVMLSAVLLLKLSSNSKLKGDSAIAVISTSALAIGVIIVSVKGTNTDLSNYMFGSILSLTTADTVTSIIVSVLIAVLFIFFYNRIFTVTFDEDFSMATGTNVSLVNTVLAILTSVTVVIGMRMMGTLLVSSLIIFPALSSIRLCKTFKGVTVVSAIISVIAFTVGLALSYELSFPTGATIVVTHLLILIISFIIQKIRNSMNLKKSKNN